jgi:hypothetical protein
MIFLSVLINCMYKKLFIVIGVFFSVLAYSQTQSIAVQAVSFVQVPVISVTELNRLLSPQTSGCVASTDPTAPIVEGAISSSQVCVGASTNEIVRTFKVVYEHFGRQYAVELPENPGPYIQLQVAPSALQNSSAPEGMYVEGALPAVVAHKILTTTVLTYPYVYYSGVTYRPMPIFVGASYRFGGGYLFGRGRGRRH